VMGFARAQPILRAGVGAHRTERAVAHEEDHGAADLRTKPAEGISASSRVTQAG
jgi:hypothetical protein